MTTDTLTGLLDQLWADYIARVTHAQRYVELVENAGGRVVNDHIALRTFNTHTGAQPAGIEGLERVFLGLGYEKKERYDFPTKKLTAYHYEHENILNPKIFISQLEVDRLPAEAQAMIAETVMNAPDLLPADMNDVAGLVKLFTRPWVPPKRSVVEAVNEHSQYAAWTLLHGNSVNHFTAFINEQQTPDMPDLVSTVEALKHMGVPMKDYIEGEVGSKLQQSSTQAVMEDCEVVEDDGSTGTINWSYAYYELAERNDVEVDGVRKQFSGFLGEQATNLFEMTKTS